MSAKSNLRPQPADFTYAPPAYPGHGYTGQGDMVTIRCAGGVVGTLSRQGTTKVGWLAGAELSDAENVIRTMVQNILRESAKKKRSLADAWADILASTQHDAPVTGALSRLVE